MIHTIMALSDYSNVAFTLPNDILIGRHTRRCTRIKYDKKFMLSIDDLPTHGYNVISFPHSQRFISPLTKEYGYRAPNLPEYIWLEEERQFMYRYEKPGIRIQIYSTINSVNIKTTYYLERTAHFMKKWKRLIVSHHLSELTPYRCHLVWEFTTDLFKEPESPPSAASQYIL